MEDNIQTDMMRKYSVPDKHNNSNDFYEGYLEKKSKEYFFRLSKKIFSLLGRKNNYLYRKKRKQTNKWPNGNKFNFFNKINRFKNIFN